MNLKTHIHPQLWLAISNTYEAENYSHSILDAIHYLSDTLREKSGQDGDGQSLVGKALGGKSPILRINKLQTESERNVQKGLEQILRGLYQGIRNPRSHDQIVDDKNTADSVIFFINFLLSILDKSQEPFTVPSFLGRVFDPHFAKQKRYADLLAEEIPTGKLTETLIELFRKRTECDDGYVLDFMANAILERMEKDQIAEYLIVVSSELKTSQDQKEIRLALQMLPAKLWPQLHEASRIRIENMLVRSILEGKGNSDGKLEGGHGWFGTWGRDYLKHFTSKYPLINAFVDKIKGDTADQLYVLNFFGRELPNIIGESYQRNSLINAFVEAVEQEWDNTVFSWLKDNFWYYPTDWQDLLKEKLPEHEFPVAQEEDDIPF